MTVTKTGGPNGVLSGLFLGGAGPPLSPPPPPPPPYEVAPQGDWVGTYGSAGYVLAAWNGTAADNDLISLPAGASAALEVGSRAVWATSGADVRALDAPDESHRRWGSTQRQRPAGAAQLRQRLQRHAPPLRGRLGQPQPPSDGERGRVAATPRPSASPPTSARAPGCTSRSTCSGRWLADRDGHQRPAVPTACCPAVPGLSDSRDATARGLRRDNRQAPLGPTAG